MENTKKDQIDYCWSYFQLHAGQRMTMFNFFIIMASLITTGIAKTYEVNSGFIWVRVILGISLIVISFTFYKLDERTKFFIKHSEQSLKNLEKAWAEQLKKENFHADLFSGEEEQTNQKKKIRAKYNIFIWHLSYSESFKIIYCLFGVLGLLGIIGSFFESNFWGVPQLKH